MVRPTRTDDLRLEILDRFLCVAFHVIVFNIYPDFPTLNVKFSLCQWLHFLGYHPNRVIKSYQNESLPLVMARQAQELIVGPRVRGKIV